MPFRKVILWVLILLLAAATAFSAAFFWYLPQYQEGKTEISVPVETDETIRIMSCNLRCLTPLDLGERSWFRRAEWIREDIQEQAPGIIGFQEATQWQYDYLVETFPEYASVIQYRDDSTITEGCPIFYHTGLYDLEEEGAFWLSETPEEMSKGWDAAHYRICSYVVLTQRQSGKTFAVFNTHLDHVSEEARIRGMEVILEKIRKFEGIPAVVMGELNDQEDSNLYRSITRDLLDARYETFDTSDSGTYHDWGQLKEPRRIGYFLLTPTGFTVTKYNVITPTHDGAYSSDHALLVLDMTLDEIRVMTHNIRCSNSADTGDRSWEVRAPLLLKDIRAQNPGIIGFQEVTSWQYEDLTEMLPEYGSVITYRSSSWDSEGCPIFYRTDTYSLMEEGAFWLSENPEVMSRGWDATYYRICSYVVLRDRQSGKRFAVFNLHLESSGKEAKVNGMQVVLDMASSFEDIPTIIMGDFNSRKNSEAYRLITQTFRDAFYETENRSGINTYHNWGDQEKAKRIDYIMISPKGFRVSRYQVLPGVHDGIYTSDHSPVVAELMIY